MRKVLVSFVWSLVATAVALVAASVLKDLGIRREIWHDVTSIDN